MSQEELRIGTLPNDGKDGEEKTTTGHWVSRKSLGAVVALLGVSAAAFYVFNSFAQDSDDNSAPQPINTSELVLSGEAENSNQIQAYNALKFFSAQMGNAIQQLGMAAMAAYLRDAAASNVLTNLHRRFNFDNNYWNLPTVYGSNYTETQNPNTYALGGNFAAAAPDGTRLTCMTNYQNPDSHISASNVEFTIADPFGNVVVQDVFANLGNVEQSSCATTYLPAGTLLPDGSTIVPAAGAFGITYQALQTGGYTNIYFSAVSLTGQSLTTQPIEINVDEAINVSQAIPVPGPNNHTLVIASSFETGTGTEGIVLYPQAQQSTLLLSSGLTGTQDNPSAISNNQKLLVSWTNAGVTPAQVVLTTITFDSNNHPIRGPLITPKVNPSAYQDFSAVALGPNGEEVIVWENGDNTASLYAYDVNGNPLFGLDDLGVTGLEKPSIAISPSGIITIVGHSKSYSTDENNWDVWRKSYTLTGTELPGIAGEASIVNSDNILGEQSYGKVVKVNLGNDLIVDAVSYRTSSVGGATLPAFTQTTRYIAPSPNIVVANNGLIDLLNFGKTLFIIPTDYYGNSNITTQVLVEIIPCSAGSINFPANTTNVVTLSLCESQISGNDTGLITQIVQGLGINLTATQGPVVLNITVLDDSGQSAYGVLITLLEKITSTLSPSGSPSSSPTSTSTYAPPPPSSPTAYIPVVTTVASILATILLTNLGNRLRQANILIKAQKHPFDKAFLLGVMSKNSDFLGRRNFSFYGSSLVGLAADIKNEFTKRGFTYSPQIRGLLGALATDALFNHMTGKGLDFSLKHVTKEVMEATAVKVIADYNSTQRNTQTFIEQRLSKQVDGSGTSASASSSAALLPDKEREATIELQMMQPELEIVDNNPNAGPPPPYSDSQSFMHRARQFLHWA
ncbi:MAG: hypothetical protein ACHP9Y_03250 [Gammaproteobacteria bacterium]